MRSDSIVIPRPDVVERLDRVVERCAGGQRSFVWLQGDMGQGKTTLLRQYRTLLRERKLRAPLVACRAPIGDLDNSSLEPQQPLKQLMAELLLEEQDEKRRKQLVQSVALTVLANLPITGYVFSFVKDLRRDLTEYKRGDQRIDAMGFAREVFDAIARSTENGPVALLLDDIQWCDRKTSEAFRAFFESDIYASKPILVIFSGRTQDIEASEHLVALRSAMARQPWMDVITVPPFQTPQTAAYLAACFPDSPSLGLLEAWLQQSSGGNPLFLHSYLQLMQSEGILDADGALHGDLHAWRGMPAEIRLVTSWLMKSLPEEDLMLMFSAAVIGFEFSLHELSHLLSRPVIDCVRGLRRIASQAGLLEYAGYRLVNGQESSVYRFTQHAIHTALYNEMTPEEREAMHRASAEYLNRIRLQSTDPAVLESLVSSLNIHARLGRQPEIAFDALLLQAQQAREFLDDDAVRGQLRELSQLLNVPWETLERTWRRMRDHPEPITAAAVLGDVAVAEPLADLVTDALNDIAAGRNADALARADARIGDDAREGRSSHPVLFLLRGLALSLLERDGRDIAAAFNAASGDGRHGVFAAAGELCTALYDTRADDETVLAALRDAAQQRGRHDEAVRRAVMRVLAQRYGGRLGEDALRGELLAFLPKDVTEEFLARMASVAPQ